MKSSGVMGVVYSRWSKLLPRSLEMTVAVKRVIKDRPKTVTPGVKCPISNSGTGILA